MMDVEREAAIAAREAAATPGPWEFHCRSCGNPDNDPSWPPDDFLQFEVTGPVEPWGRGDFIGVDAAFVAHARADVPYLLSALAAAREEAAAERETVRKLQAELADKGAQLNVERAATDAANARAQSYAAEAAKATRQRDGLADGLRRIARSGEGWIPGCRTARQALITAGLPLAAGDPS